MKKVSSLIVLSLVTFSVWAGQSDQNTSTLPPLMMHHWYAGGQIGLAVPGGSGSAAVSTGFNIVGQGGYRFNRNFRVELGFYYLRNSIKAFPTFSYSALMTNAYFSVPLNYGVTPFIGAGIGWGHTYQGGGVFVPTSTNQFAYQGILGLAYYVNENLAVDTTYHLFSWTAAGGYENLLNVGVNYYFI